MLTCLPWTDWLVLNNSNNKKGVVKLDTTLKRTKPKGKPMVVWFVVCTLENAGYFLKEVCVIERTKTVKEELVFMVG